MPEIRQQSRCIRCLCLSFAFGVHLPVSNLSPRYAVAAKRKDRSQFWIRSTYHVQLLSLVAYLAMMSEHRHTVEPMPLILLPVLWGFCPLIFGRSDEERRVGYWTACLSICWLWFA